MIHFIFTTLYLLFFIYPVLSTPQKVDLLISTYDTRDKNSLLPMAAKLKKKVPGQKKGIRYKILAFGVSKEQLKTHPALVEFIIQKDVRHMKRTDTLSGEELHQLDQEVEPKLVIAGMTSKIQAQVLNHFKSKGAHVVAFYDSFDPFDATPYTQPFFEEIGLIDAYMVPHQGLVEPLKAKLKAKNQKAEIIVSGQPALEDWEKAFAKAEVNALKTRLKLDAKKKTILFVGGAYEGEYPKYLQIFFDAVREMKNIQVLVTPHPKMTGNLEKSAAEGLVHVQILDSKMAPTPQIAPLVDIILTHKSSVGMQALYMGIPVLYIAGPDYKNFATAAGIASRVADAGTLRVAIEGIVSAGAKVQKADIAKKIGMPREGSEIMANYVRTKVIPNMKS